MDHYCHSVHLPLLIAYCSYISYLTIQQGYIMFSYCMLCFAVAAVVYKLCYFAVYFAHFLHFNLVLISFFFCMVKYL